MMIDLKYLALITSALLGGEFLAAVPPSFPQQDTEALSAEDFLVREKAYDEIEQWAVKNVKTSPEVLYSFWQQQKHPESRARADRLMREAFSLRLEKRGFGFVGISLSEALMRKPTEENLGVRVGSVSPGLAGERAGLQVGDVVVAFDDIPFAELIEKFSREDGPKVSASQCFIYYIMMLPPDSVVSMRLIRGGDIVSKKVKLVKRPEEILPKPRDLKVVNQILFNQWVERQGQ